MSALTRLREQVVDLAAPHGCSPGELRAIEDVQGAVLALIDLFIEAENADPAARVPDAVERFYKAVKERALVYLTTRTMSGASDVLSALDDEITDYRRRR